MYFIKLYHYKSSDPRIKTAEHTPKNNQERRTDRNSEKNG